MDLKEKLLASYAVFENNLDVEDPILDLRMTLLKFLKIRGFLPKRKKHGNIRLLEKYS